LNGYFDVKKLYKFVLLTKNPDSAPVCESDGLAKFIELQSRLVLEYTKTFSTGRRLCPLPPLLSRSNSTGSVVNSRQSSQKHASMKASQSLASTGYPKPPLEKGTHGSYGNGVRISPVLNVPSVNLFGLGSIFSYSGKDKNKKK
jgi:hypothetical protein